MIQFIPNNNLQKTDRIQVMRNNGKEYLVITEPLHSPNFIVSITFSSDDNNWC